jgi:hypothetical protein
LLRLGIVALTLSTAYIHFTLGGLMFLANAAGYLLLGLAMIAPLPVASRYRWLIRGLLLLFAVATIGGWVMFGARYWLGYLAKAIELGLIALLAVEMLRYDDGPVAVAQRAWTLGLSVLRRLTGRSAA